MELILKEKFKSIETSEKSVLKNVIGYLCKCTNNGCPDGCLTLTFEGHPAKSHINSLNFGGLDSCRTTKYGIQATKRLIGLHILVNRFTLVLNVKDGKSGLNVIMTWRREIVKRLQYRHRWPLTLNDSEGTTSKSKREKNVALHLTNTRLCVSVLSQDCVKVYCIYPLEQIYQCNVSITNTDQQLLTIVLKNTTNKSNNIFQTLQFIAPERNAGDIVIQIESLQKVLKLYSTNHSSPQPCQKLEINLPKPKETQQIFNKAVNNLCGDFSEEFLLLSNQSSDSNLSLGTDTRINCGSQSEMKRDDYVSFVEKFQENSFLDLQKLAEDYDDYHLKVDFSGKMCEDDNYWSPKHISYTLDAVLAKYVPSPDTLGIKYRARRSLCYELYTQDSWLDLAEYIGLTYQMLELIKQFLHYHGCELATEIVLRFWQFSHNKGILYQHQGQLWPCTTKSLKLILEKIDRFDAIELIL